MASSDTQRQSVPKDVIWLPADWRDRFDPADDKWLRNELDPAIKFDIDFHSTFQELDRLIKGFQYDLVRLRKAFEHEAHERAEELRARTEALLSAAPELADDPSLQGYWRKIQDRINSFNSDLEYPEQPLYSVEGQIHHALQIIGVFLKNPVTTAFLGATATRIVGAIAEWSKKKLRKHEKVIVKLYGPDGKLLERKEVD